MSAEDQGVYLGAVGWVHASWRAAFYPDDLPEDWLLAYYNTQYRSVFLPYAAWAHIAPEAWARWVEDTRPGFRFVLERPPAGAMPASIEPESLGDRLGRVAGREDPHLLWFDASTDLKALARQIGRGDRPLYLFSADADLDGLQRVATLLELMGL